MTPEPLAVDSESFVFPRCCFATLQRVNRHRYKQINTATNTGDQQQDLL